MLLSLVIPFYNEERNVERVLMDCKMALTEKRIPYEIIAVNNGSSDTTSELIDKQAKQDKRIKKITVTKNIGYGNGIISGLTAAKGEILSWIDGDCQVNPSFVAELYLLAVEKGRGVIYKVDRDERNDSINREIFSRGYNALLRVLFRAGLTDVNAKPKMFYREDFVALNPQSKDWFIDTELLVKAKRAGYKILSIPAVFEKRKEGVSHVKINVVVEFLKNIWKLY